jgi:hypothetical protein
MAVGIPPHQEASAAACRRDRPLRAAAIGGCVPLRSAAHSAEHARGPSDPAANAVSSRQRPGNPMAR